MDMLVKLYDLPDSRGSFERLRQRGIHIRRALTAEKHKVGAWVRENFAEGWASETEIAFGRQPISSFIAVKAGKIAGFACHDVTCRNFFGPTGAFAAPSRISCMQTGLCRMRTESLAGPSPRTGKRISKRQRRRAPIRFRTVFVSHRDRERAITAAPNRGKSRVFREDRELGVSAGLRGGAGRTRTGNQTVISPSRQVPMRHAQTRHRMPKAGNENGARSLPRSSNGPPRGTLAQDGRVARWASRLAPAGPGDRYEAQVASGMPESARPSARPGRASDRPRNGPASPSTFLTGYHTCACRDGFRRDSPPAC
jgi:hypothetical protein